LRIFELLGPADVDNAGVPNVPEAGLESWFFGHGLGLTVGDPYFLSDPVDIEALPHRTDEGGLVAREFVRFPREALLDVLATESDAADIDQLIAPPCREAVHRNFDRLAGGFVEHGEDLEYSVQRLVIDTTPDGRAILQDTNTSAVDLVRACIPWARCPNRSSAEQGARQGNESIHGGRAPLTVNHRVPTVDPSRGSRVSIPTEPAGDRGGWTLDHGALLVSPPLRRSV
jgi:hypothetical protein